MLTIWPWPCRFIVGKAARESRNGPRRFTPTIRSQSATLSSSIGSVTSTPGVVDQDVKVAVTVHDRPHGLSTDRSRVTSSASGSAVPRPPDDAGRALGALAPDVSHDGARAVCPEHVADRRPEAAATARHQGDLSAEGSRTVPCHSPTDAPLARAWLPFRATSVAGIPTSRSLPFAASSRRLRVPRGVRRWSGWRPGVLDKLGQQVQDHKVDLLDVLRIGGRDHQREIGAGQGVAAVTAEQRDAAVPRCFAARKAATTFFERPLVLIATRTSPGWPSASTCRANTSS